jgi:hypothetical protein
MLKLTKEEIIKKEHRFKLYLNCLLEFRYNSYNELLSIGEAMYNEQCTYDLFETFSKLSSSFDQKTCVIMWASYSNQIVQQVKQLLSNVIEKAKIDCSEQSRYILIYDAKTNDEVDLLNNLFTSGYSDSDMAHLFYTLEKHNFIYVSYTHSWYFYNNVGNFIKGASREQLYACFKTNILDILVKEHSIRIKRLQESLAVEKQLLDEFDNKDNKCKLKKKEKNKEKNKEKKNLTEKYNLIYKEIKKTHAIMIKLHNSLHNTTVLNHAINILCRIYSVSNISQCETTFSNFYRYNMNLVGFTNGAYDLENYVFRKATRLERMIVNTQYDYALCNAIKKQKLLKILENIFPDKSKLTHLLKILSLSLTGEYNSHKIYLFIGDKTSGTNIIQSLMESTLGDYFHTVSATSLFSSKKQLTVKTHSDPNNIIFTRYYSITDINITHLTNRSFFKKIRDCHTLESIDPDLTKDKLWMLQVTTYLQSDVDLDLNLLREDYRNRIVLVKFLNSNIVEKLEKKLGVNLDVVIKSHEYRLEMMDILLEHYKLYKKEGL